MFIQLVVLVIVAGILLWVVTQYVPMHPAIKNLLVALVVVALVLYGLHTLGLLHWGPLRGLPR